MAIDVGFLESCLLGELSPADKASLLEVLVAELEFRVGTVLSDGFSSAQLDEFEALQAGDDAVTKPWLSAHVPDYVNDPEFRRLSVDAVGEEAERRVRADFAALRWLAMHRPDYRDVVAEHERLLGGDVRARQPEILAAVGLTPWPRLVAQNGGASGNSLT